MKSQASERTGAAIRKLRLAKGLTLAELSEQTGVPLSTLSRVELGQNALKYENLVRLCQALDVDLQGLVSREAEGSAIASGRRSVIRAGEGDPVSLGPNRGLRGGADLLSKSFTPVVLEVTASDLAEHGPMRALPSEAYLLVLCGSVVLHSQLYAPLRLGVGDAVYFDGRAEHALVAGDEGPAQALLISAGEGSLGD